MRAFADERKSGPIPYYDSYYILPCAILRLINTRNYREFVKVTNRRFWYGFVDKAVIFGFSLYYSIRTIYIFLVFLFTVSKSLIIASQALFYLSSVCRYYYLISRDSN
jgi:hypothetical protein